MFRLIHKLSSSTGLKYTLNEHVHGTHVVYKCLLIYFYARARRWLVNKSKHVAL
jgi:hypothetical protein